MLNIEFIEYSKSKLIDIDEIYVISDMTLY